MSSRLKIVWIIISVAALAIIFSPVFSIPSVFQNPGGNSVISEEPVNETAIAPPQISDEILEECNAINDDVQAIIVDVDESRANATRKIASDLVLGEYCNRPALVQEISATGYPALSLTAYACDSASGKIGDAQLKDSLVDHRAIYCESASFSIQEEADGLRTGAEGFREGYIQDLKEDNSTSSEFITELEASLDEILGMINNAQALLSAGQNYDAAKMLDTASRAFEALIEKAEQDA